MIYLQLIVPFYVMFKRSFGSRRSFTLSSPYSLYRSFPSTNQAVSTEDFPFNFFNRFAISGAISSAILICLPFRFLLLTNIFIFDLLERNLTMTALGFKLLRSLPSAFACNFFPTRWTKMALSLKKAISKAFKLFPYLDDLKNEQRE